MWVLEYSCPVNLGLEKKDRRDTPEIRTQPRSQHRKAQAQENIDHLDWLSRNRFIPRYDSLTEKKSTDSPRTQLQPPFSRSAKKITQSPT